MSFLLQQLCQPCVSAALSRVVFFVAEYPLCDIARAHRSRPSSCRPSPVKAPPLARTLRARVHRFLFFCLHAFTHVSQSAVDELIRGEDFGFRTFTIPSPVGCFTDRSLPRGTGEGAEGEGADPKVFIPNQMWMRRFRHVGEGVKAKNGNHLTCT